MEKILSASRIKTLETCSYSYWCNYHLKLPQKQNEGAARGDIVHVIFEALLLSRRKKYVAAILKAGSAYIYPSIERLVRIKLNKYGFLTEENVKMVEDMLLVGLSSDFFSKGASELGEPEKEFIIENEDPKYKIKGFIDKHSIFEDGTVKIYDYKSSKSKFKDEEIISNHQAFTYTLAVKKAPAFKEISDKIKKVITKFIFLRFPKNPVQETPEISESELAGFEYYLAHMYEVINSFTVKDAHSNFAADKEKTKWLCKAGKTWKCPYYSPFEYYEVRNEKDEIVKGYFKDELPTKLKDGHKAVLKKYHGCPRFYPTANKQAEQE